MPDRRGSRRAFGSGRLDDSPPVVIANRIREAALESTNFLGFNTPAIIQTNAEYGEYWAQNATAMTGYATAAAGIASGLSVPLRPPMITGGDAGMAAGVASMAAEGVQSGVQASMQGLSAPLQAAGQAASSAAPAAMSAASNAASGLSNTKGSESAAAQSPAASQPGSTDLLGSSDSMMGLASAAPSAMSGLGQPLSQLGQIPGQIGGQLGGMMGSMGLGGGPFGGLSVSSPGANSGFRGQWSEWELRRWRRPCHRGVDQDRWDERGKRPYRHPFGVVGSGVRGRRPRREQPEQTHCGREAGDRSGKRGRLGRTRCYADGGRARRAAPRLHGRRQRRHIAIGDARRLRRGTRPHH